MNPATRNTLIRLSTDEGLSEAFRRACRVELGDCPDEAIVIRRRWRG